MKHWRSILIVAMIAGLTGCAASMVRSEVTVFQDWPASTGEKLFIFERSRDQDNNLEYRTYENLVRTELRRLGFSETTGSGAARLKVTLGYGMQSRDVRLVEGTVTEPFWSTEPFYGHRWRGRGYYGPYYDPFWPEQARTEFTDSTYQVFMRQLKVRIAQVPSGKNLFDATVNSEGTNGTLAAVMPYMVHSAFSDFPGVNGVPRHIAIKMHD